MLQRSMDFEGSQTKTATVPFRTSKAAQSGVLRHKNRRQVRADMILTQHFDQGLRGGVGVGRELSKAVSAGDHLGVYHRQVSREHCPDQNAEHAPL